METQENNILIAQFMGFDFSRFKNDGIIEPQEEIFFTDSKTFSVDELKFNTDWNWLMEVVEKIESLKIDKLSFNFQIEKDKVSFYYTHISEPKKQTEMFFEWGQKTKIGNTYKIVVEFIKWYNEQK